MSSLKSIRANFGANSLSVGLTLIFQLTMVPIFITYWGLNLYGEWLTLTAFTAYFSMSEIGLTTVTSNEFSISYAQSKYNQCNTLLNNNLYFILIIFITIILLLLSFLSVINLSQLFRFTQMSEWTVQIGMMILVLRVFLGMFENLLNMIYRALQHYARAIMIKNAMILSENLILITSVILKFPMDLLFMLYILPRIIGLFLQYIDLKKYYEIKIGLKYIDLVSFRKMISPSLFFMSFPIGNAIIVQGFVLLINFMLGSATVVLFTTTRTMVNLIKTGLGLINNSVWPEFSLAFGRKDFLSMKELHRYAVGVSFYLSIFSALGLYLFGENIYILWTDAKIEFDRVLFLTFLLTLVSNTIWFTSSVVLASTNNHKKYASYFLLASIFSIGIAYVILRVTEKITYIPIALLIIDIILSRIVIKQSLEIVHDKFYDFALAVVMTPLYILKIKN